MMLALLIAIPILLAAALVLVIALAGSESHEGRNR